MMDTSEVDQIKEILSPEVTNETAAEVSDETQADVESQAGDEEAAQLQPVDDTDGDAGDTGDDNDEPSDAVETYTVSEYAEATGWTAKDMYESVIIPMDNGEKLPLGEMKNGYQDAQREIVTLKSDLEAAKSTAEQVQSVGVNNQQVSQEMLEKMGALQSIDAAEKSTDWEELESLDPSEALLKRDKIRRARDQVTGEIQQLQYQQQQQQQAYLQQATAKMYELVPEWKDTEVFSKDKESMRVVMRDFGFTDDETNTIADPRQMALLNRFTKLLDKEKSASSAVKKVRQAPKTLKGRQVVASTADDNVTALANKARKSGNKNDELDAVKAILRQR